DADGHTHVNRFIDMHDVGDALVRAGLDAPGMDVGYLTVTYRDVPGLMRDLRTMGASNATARRNRGLSARRRHAAAEAWYEGLRADGRLPATWEVVYGHAWAGMPGRDHEAPSGEVAVPLTRIGRRR